MKNRKKNILFITNELSRTGAPMLLLDLVKWLKKQEPQYNIYILSKTGSALIGEFSAIAKDVFHWDEPSNSIFNRIKRKSFLSAANLVTLKIRRIKWQLVFSNTAVNGKILDKLNVDEAVPVISYIHELEYVLDYFAKRGEIQGTLKRSNFFLCGSKAVQQNLLQNHKIDEERTKIVYSFSDIKKSERNNEMRDQLREELGIPTKNLIVLMMGGLSWRKGADIFAELAVECTDEPFSFVWVGSDTDGSLEKVKYDIDQLNVKPNLVFLESVKEYRKYFNLCDVFFLSSREDPYPLVVVEAANYGIPLICFQGSGGIPEFVSEKIGFVAPYKNTSSIKKFLLDFDRNLYNAQYIRDQSYLYHNIDQNASRVLSIIKSHIL